MTWLIKKRHRKPRIRRRVLSAERKWSSYVSHLFCSLGNSRTSRWLVRGAVLRKSSGSNAVEILHFRPGSQHLVAGYAGRLQPVVGQQQSLLTIHQKRLSRPPRRTVHFQVGSRSGHLTPPPAMSAYPAIVLQKSKVAALLNFRESKKRETITDSYTLNRAARSPVSLTWEDQSPHIFIRKTRLQPAEFLIACAKRLLQHNPRNSRRFVQ